jgi:hypothetical protein
LAGSTTRRLARSSVYTANTGHGRIERAREDAARRLAKDRDVVGFQAAMTRLDTEERIARVPVELRRLTPPEIVAYLRSLPALWADSGPDGRQALATAIFARTDVMGFQRLEYELTTDAIELGLDAALPRDGARKPDR